MQCVILAAGEGTRMHPLTLQTPKPLIKVAGKPIIEHIVLALPEAITELVIVVGYKGHMLREYCGSSFCGRTVTYVEQADPKAGTGDALWAARLALSGRFLVMYGDDIHGAHALAEALAYEHAFLAARSPQPERFGVVKCNTDGTLQSIIEKPKNPPSDLVNIGGFVVTEDIFSYPMAKSPQGEYFLTDTVTAYAADHPVSVILQPLWIPIGYPEDVEKAERRLSGKV